MNKLDKNNGFITPDGYFEGLKGKLMGKLSKEDSVLPKENGFIVPKNYFESFDSRVLKKLGNKESKVISLNHYRKYYYVAASIAAILAVILTFNLNVEETPSFDDLAIATIEDYFDNYEMNFSEDELTELLPMQEVGVNDILNREIDQEEIIDYLDVKIDDLHELNTMYNEE